MDNNEMIKYESPDFGAVRTVMIGGEPWFVASDVCAAIEVDRTAIRRLDDDEKGVHLTHTPGGKQKVVVVNEPGLYSLIIGSRKPEARAFKRWITHEVIPSIRKYGGYMTESVLDRVMTEPQVIYQLAESLLTERYRAETLDRELRAAKPKAEYYDAFVNPKDCTNIRNTANELDIPQRQFVSWLLKERILYRDFAGQLLPYSTYLRNGFFIVRDYARNGHKGVQTLFTPYGKEHILRMYLM